MALCVTENGGTGALEIVSSQPTDYTSCTMVVLSGAEAGASPLALSAADGLQVAAAVVAVWGVAWAVKALILTLKEERSHESDGQ